MRRRDPRPESTNCCATDGNTVNQVKVTLEPIDHPYRNGAWTLVFEELGQDDLEIIGKIPADIDDLYINPYHGKSGAWQAWTLSSL